MTKVKIAFRQLFLARGCTVVGDSEVRHLFKVSDFDVEFYIGKDPSLPIETTSKHAAVFDPTQDKFVPLRIGSHMAADSEYKGSLFLEVFISRYFEISEVDFDQLGAPETEVEVRRRVLAEFRNEYDVQVKTVANLISGLVGLRMHNQFTHETINETYWMWMNKNSYWAPEGIRSQAVQILRKIELTDVGIEIIKGFKDSPEAKIKEMEKSSLCLLLLRKGWQEPNAIYRFIHFFTALEIVTHHKTEGGDQKEKEIIEKIREIISRADLNTQKVINPFVDGLQARSKSLKKRFREMAVEANFESRDKDVLAFEAFYLARNKLFHGGSSSSLVVSVLGEDVALERLAEQYVNWAIFGDDRPYEGGIKRPRFSESK